MSGSFTDPVAAQMAVPRLSVIIVSVSGAGLLTACLAALAEQTAAGDDEIVVVRHLDRLHEPSAAIVKNRFPDVRWVEAPQNSTVPRMRSIAITESRGDIVALLEDDCLVEPGWRDAVVAAHRTPDVAIAGAVEPGPYQRTLDWGAYFCDYGRFMLPLPQGAIAALPGNNTSYKRAAFAQLPAECAREFYEVFVHWAWQEARLPMRADENVRVRNVHTWTFADVTSVPYHHGRAFAAQRLAREPLWRRVTFSALALFLPALKVARLARETVSRRRFIGRLILALPWVLVFTTSWSIGESVGSLFGPGGSASRWR